MLFIPDSISIIIMCICILDQTGRYGTLVVPGIHKGHKVVHYSKQTNFFHHGNNMCRYYFVQMVIIQCFAYLMDYFLVDEIYALTIIQK